MSGHLPETFAALFFY